MEETQVRDLITSRIITGIEGSTDEWIPEIDWKASGELGRKDI